MLKTGIAFADQITTVSPRYAEEIQTAEHGHGLEGAISARRDHLTGIMNGIDDEIWNPASDSYLACNYDYENWQQGKLQCKQALLERLQMPPLENKPLIGLIGRLASQKGWSIILPVIEQWLQTIDVQWVVLGTGESSYEQSLFELANRYPDRLAACLKFSDELAHQIEAGSDIFLMPSEYEPCGLNQLYSLRYGTVPVVRATGGLADSITDASPEHLQNRTANGFVFDNYSMLDMETALARAVVTYLERPLEWRTIVKIGMQQDWSWRRSAERYAEVYRQVIQQDEHHVQQDQHNAQQSLG